MSRKRWRKRPARARAPKDGPAGPPRQDLVGGQGENREQRCRGRLGGGSRDRGHGPGANARLTCCRNRVPWSPRRAVESSRFSVVNSPSASGMHVAILGSGACAFRLVVRIAATGDADALPLRGRALCCASRGRHDGRWDGPGFG